MAPILQSKQVGFALHNLFTYSKSIIIILPITRSHVIGKQYNSGCHIVLQECTPIELGIHVTCFMLIPSQNIILYMTQSVC